MAALLLELSSQAGWSARAKFSQKLMGRNVIEITGLGKQYQIGTSRQIHDTFVDALSARLAWSRFARGGVQRRDTIWALRDIDLEIKRGDVVAFLGRNGAGKSTLLKILARITEPTVGRAVVRGQLSALLEVGAGFHPELTGRENIFLNGAILGMRRVDIIRKFDQIVAFAELEKFIDTPVKRYSSGMYVRLGFSVAAHLDPEILLVDEVLAVGDLAFQRKCLGAMQDIVKEGRTVLFVSHRLASIRKLCKLAYWIDEGRIRAAGPANRIVDLYEDEMAQWGRITSASAKQTVVVPDAGITILSVTAEVVRRNTTHTLRLTVQIRASRPVPRIGMSLRLSSLDGVLVCKVDSRVTAPSLQDLQGDNACVFEFEDVTRYLAGGAYVAEVVLSAPEIGRIVSVPNAAHIEVPLVDAHNVGKYFSAERNGFVPLPVRFHCERAECAAAASAGAQD